MGAGWVEPTSVCVAVYVSNRSGTLYYCARADQGNIRAATCGSTRSCEVGEVCARRAAGEPFECLPCTSD